MIRRPPRSTPSNSSAASDVYKRQTYDTGTAAAGPLNGRALADDVIDAELNIVTGGFAFDGRDGTGAITGDCVGAHDDYLSAFPYLGEPHA